MTIESNHSTEATQRHRKPQEKAPFLYLRQWLNIIFMLGAIIGVCVYLMADTTIGTYIILGAMLFKIVECSLRFIPK